MNLVLSLKEINNIPYHIGESTTNSQYNPGGIDNTNKGYAWYQSVSKGKRQNPWCVAEVNEEANAIELTVIYMIVGYDQVFTISHILYPTRV